MDTSLTPAEIRAAIIAHFRKTGRCPNYPTVGGYDAAYPVFEAMKAEGALVWATRLSKTGKRMNYLVLPDMIDGVEFVRSAS